jgi:hypothetical protein
MQTWLVSREIWPRVSPGRPNRPGPWVYWFPLSGNLSKEGITADLEALQRVGIEAGPHHPAQLAMCIRAFANELRPRAQNEIALHPLPEEMALVTPEPHVRPPGSDGIFLTRRVVLGRAGELRRANVGVPVKLAEGAILVTGTGDSSGEREGHKS